MLTEHDIKPGFVCQDSNYIYLILKVRHRTMGIAVFRKGQEGKTTFHNSLMVDMFVEDINFWASRDGFEPRITK